MSPSPQARPGLARILPGLGLWIAYAVWTVPNFLDEAWAKALIVFAALVLLPLVWPLAEFVGEPAWAVAVRWLVGRLQFPAALLLAWGFHRPQGPGAALLALPWCAVLVLQAIRGLAELARSWRTPSLLAACVGLAYGAVGAAWTLADRSGFRPLDFDPAIVLLTAAHFHVAGVVLPVLAGCACRELKSPALAAVLAWFVASGVFLVAIGITSSRLGFTHAIEGVAATALSVSGLAVAVVQLRMATRSEFSFGAQLCLGVSACALLMGMAFSFLYGLRFAAMPLPWLDIPWMRALHGSANAIGFGLFGCLGWRLALRTDAQSGVLAA